MPRITRYFPFRIGDQIIWLRNFRNKLGNYQAVLDYETAELTTIIADCDRSIYLLDTVNGAVQSFGTAITSHLKLVLNGPAMPDPVAIPTFALPATPAAPANVPPGALKRVFAFIKNLKTRAGYTDDIGEDLQIVGTEAVDDPNEVPTASAEARSGEVVLKFSKNGHLGVYLESQIGAETEWSYLAIDTTSPYNDTRPLKVAGQPEKRRYRLCFWDGDPTKVWTDVIEVVFGG
jgi:hypothetical protein